MPSMSEIIAKLNEGYEETVQSESAEKYGRLSTMFEDLGVYLREYIQEITQEDIKGIIDKLKKGSQISPEDLAYIKMWIVGDAEHYTKLENNVEDWKAEVKRLMGEINNMNQDNPDAETASRLRGLLRDGSRVLADLFYFLGQKDRVSRFEDATREIDSEERTLLVNLLEQKLKSGEF